MGPLRGGCGGDPLPGVAGPARFEDLDEVVAAAEDPRFERIATTGAPSIGRRWMRRLPSPALTSAFRAGAAGGKRVAEQVEEETEGVGVEFPERG